MKEPVQIHTLIIINPIETSYEIICAAERNAPKKGYLELLDHPAVMIPYTLSEDVANKYRIPTLISDITTCSDNGITAQPIKLKIKVIIGAIKKIVKLELLGIIVSLTNNFKPSANGCNRPINPMTLGPFLLCIIPIIFLSAIVKYATEINKGIIIARIFNTVQIINKIIFSLNVKTQDTNSDKVGFEPTVFLNTIVFKTNALNHSTTYPTIAKEGT